MFLNLISNLLDIYMLLNDTKNISVTIVKLYLGFTLPRQVLLSRYNGQITWSNFDKEVRIMFQEIQQSCFYKKHEKSDLQTVKISF